MIEVMSEIIRIVGTVTVWLFIVIVAVVLLWLFWNGLECLSLDCGEDDSASED